MGRSPGPVWPGPDWGPTGDGLVTAGYVLYCLAESGAPLEEWGRRWRRLPSAQRAVPAPLSRPPIESLPGLSGEIARAREALGPSGRLVVRYSGTEPVLRILVEGQEAPAVEAWADRLAKAASGPHPA